MKMNKLVKALAIAVTSFGIATNAAAEERSYILATASTGGTYYPVGVALATLSKVKL
ncbi:TAXI family TRAP transporter solute-binding subunit, partial [Vibrio sp. 2089]